jgi:hypothetical protein
MADDQLGFETPSPVKERNPKRLSQRERKKELEKAMRVEKLKAYERIMMIASFCYFLSFF